MIRYARNEGRKTRIAYYGVVNIIVYTLSKYLKWHIRGSWGRRGGGGGGGGRGGGGMVGGGGGGWGGVSEKAAAARCERLKRRES